jgi:ribonuclease-3
MRANLVKQDTLHQLAVELGLPADVIRLGEGEVRSGGQEAPFHPGRCAGGPDRCGVPGRGLHRRAGAGAPAVQGVDINPTMAAIGKDPKTELQEWLQGRKMRLPLYRVVATIGAAHQQSFDVECEDRRTRLSERGIGGSRRAGEQVPPPPCCRP